VEQRLQSGRPTLIPVEELWAPLMRSVFANRIDQWLLTLRKQNAAVLLVAHSVGQLHQLPNRHVLIESCATKIFLPNPEAKAEEARRLYAELGLNEREIEILAESVPKKHYYFKSPRGSRRFELALGPAALSLLASAEGMTMEETRRQVQALAIRHGAVWPAVWLRERGLGDWSERFNRLIGGQDDEASCAA
jgi:type IV secretion system protein VirB4